MLMTNDKTAQDVVKIFLDPIPLDLRIGICAHEKDAPQRVMVKIALYTSAKPYLDQISSETIIDYAPLYEYVQGWVNRPQVGLIESYLKELADFCFEIKAVEKVELSIHKLDIFGQNQGAGVELNASRSVWLAA